MSMFCFQCQETAQNKGCTRVGVCGKSASVSNKMDLLTWNLRGLSAILLRAREEGHKVPVEDNHLITVGLFSTITNANFDEEAIDAYIARTLETKQAWLAKLKNTADLPEAALWQDKPSAWAAKSEAVGVLAEENEDIRSLKELSLYGLRGMAAYMKHANALDHEEESLDIELQKLMRAGLETHSLGEWVQLVLKTGEIGVGGMALLDKANTDAYGNPEITEVKIGVGKRPGILISGHDLHDMEMLLEQSRDAGVDIYTHSEMLPANYYPKFKKYPHFYGNYGNAWWQQKTEFESFHGPILMTTNCIVPPAESYKHRLFTTGAAGYPGCPHIPGSAGEHKDFSAIIEMARTCAAPDPIDEGTLVGGFAHAQVFALADKIVEAVKSGAIRRFVVMGGCDGRQKSRSYYTEFAEKLPKDTVILTAGCAKYRYNKLGLGDINGIPRVLDAGQCNDSYSLAIIALKLKEIFGLEDINELPLSFNIAWYEQKAVIVLLALLYLGFKNVHVGPTLPAFLSPNVTKVLAEQFGIGTITTVEEDLEAIFG